MLVGLDEAGVGPAFGSLWAAAVAHDGAWPAGLTDSKRLTPARREALRAALEEKGVYYGLGEVTAREIDTHGLGHARRLVFERALDDLRARFPNAPMPSRLVVDGTIFGAWRDVPHECVPRADATVPEVSAASIFAKTTRDAQVVAWCDADPTLDERYAIRANKGYLSARHVAGLRAHGWSAHHRTSYRVRALQEDDDTHPR